VDNVPELVERDPVTGQILQVTSPFVNLAKQKAEGIDFDIRYDSDTWYAGGLVTYLVNFERQETDGGALVDLDGNRVNGVAYPLWRAQGYVGAAFGDWNGQVTVNYRDGMEDSNVDPQGEPASVDDYTTVDLQVNYTGLKNITLTAGGTNIFDREPPFVVDDFGGYERGVIDPRGAFWYLQFKYTMGAK
jgi:iron complex outermembrane receptor protein